MTEEKKPKSKEMRSCPYCCKKINKAEICEMTISIGPDIERIKDFVKVFIHLACRDKIYNSIAEASDQEKKRINEEIVDMASRYSGRPVRTKANDTEETEY